MKWTREITAPSYHATRTAVPGPADGRLLAGSNFSGAHPLAIDPGYLREASDRETLLAALDHALDLGSTRALAPFVSGLVPPAKSNMTRPEKLDFIAANAASGLHYAGTCSAGLDPRRHVVDQFFRVWGVDRLRVVDASVVPEVPGVNTQATVLSLAELAAESMGFAP